MTTKQHTADTAPASQLLDVIANQLSMLPKWVRIFVTII